jgi:hypothetical protein
MAIFPNAFARLKPLSQGHLAHPASILGGTAHTQRTVQSRQAAPRTLPFTSLPQEPEDARITGGTRSLDRRLLALNVSGTRKAVMPQPMNLLKSA